VNYRLVFLGLLGILATIYINSGDDYYEIYPVPQAIGVVVFLVAIGTLLGKSSFGIVDLLIPLSAVEALTQFAIGFQKGFTQTEEPPKQIPRPTEITLSTFLEMAPAIYLLLNA